MKTSGEYRPTSQAQVANPGGGANGSAALTGPERVLVQDNNGAINSGDITAFTKSFGVDVSNWTLNSGNALPATAHLMNITIIGRANCTFVTGVPSLTLRARYKFPDGSWSGVIGVTVNTNTAFADYVVATIDVDNVFDTAYVLGPTFVVEMWWENNNSNPIPINGVQIDVVKVKFDYIDSYNNVVTMLPTYMNNFRGTTEPLWTNPTDALTENSVAASVQLFTSTIDLTAWLWGNYAAIPNLTSVSQVRITHRVRYQNQTSPGTSVNPTVRWTWLLVDGWGTTGGPIPIYVNSRQLSQTGTVKWPFAIDVWGKYANNITVPDTDLAWIATALQAGKFGAALVYTFPTTYSSQRLNFYVDVQEIEVRYTGGPPGGTARGLFFRGIP